MSEIAYGLTAKERRRLLAGCRRLMGRGKGQYRVGWAEGKENAVRVLVFNQYGNYLKVEGGAVVWGSGFWVSLLEFVDERLAAGWDRERVDLGGQHLRAGVLTALNTFYRASGWGFCELEYGCPFAHRLDGEKDEKITPV